MSEDHHRALELATRAGETADATVARAHAYHAFLMQQPGGGTGGVKAAAAAAPKPAAAAPAAKPAAAPAGKPAGKPNGAAGGATQRTAQTAGNKPAVKPAADATKDAAGKNTLDDVVKALRTVLAKPGDADANKKQGYEILETVGGGAKAVKDLKPAFYDAVVAACVAALKAPLKAPVAEASDDDFGAAGSTAAAAPDTSGASSEIDLDADMPDGG